MNASPAPPRPPASKQRLLNVGCGHTLHADWINIDIAPGSPAVVKWDLRKGLPFPDRSFDAVYCSHVLEHLAQEDAQRAASEMFRVLRPGGIARLVVPDLERIAREYLRLLHEVEAGREGRQADYDWIMLELYDQAVRSVPGGAMGEYLARPDLSNRDFVVSRIGAEAQGLRNAAPPGARLRERHPLELSRRGWQRLRGALARAVVRAIAGRQAAQAFSDGVFRRSGEIHQWMYDRFSLGRLLRRAGFEEVAPVDAQRSRIPGFAAYRLDTDDGGRVRKPDSLFMEALRPD